MFCQINFIQMVFEWRQSWHSSSVHCAGASWKARLINLPSFKDFSISKIKSFYAYIRVVNYEWNISLSSRLQGRTLRCGIFIKGRVNIISRVENLFFRFNVIWLMAFRGQILNFFHMISTKIFEASFFHFFCWQQIVNLRNLNNWGG